MSSPPGPSLLPDDADALADAVCDRLVQAGCVFLTGEAGTGKTHLTRAILERLGSTALVTAYTGVAALQLRDGNAMTVHKALGMPVFERGTAPERAVQSVVAYFQGVALGSIQDRRARETRQRIRNHDVLVVDEVGMVPADMLGHIDLALRIVRQCPDRPFGGMGVLAVGDVLQLPPVDASSGFVFRAPVWAAFGTVLLRKVHRQLDSSLTPLLNSLRMGRPPMGEALTLGVICEARNVTGCKAVALMSRRDAVARVNEEQMTRLTAKAAAVVRTPVPVATSGNSLVAEELKEAVIDELHCRGKGAQTWAVGMRVMVVRNFKGRVVETEDSDDEDEKKESVVNGDTGTVVRLDGKGRDGGEWPVVELDRFPGRPVVVEAVDWMRAHCGAVHRDPGNHRPTGHGAECFTKVSAVPLIPAWAMTCHKAQGATVPVCTKVVVHATGNSAAGSLYVAASRVRDKDQLAFVGNGWRTPSASGEARQFFTDLVRRAAAADAATGDDKPCTWTWTKNGFARSGGGAVHSTAHLAVWIPAAAPQPTDEATPDTATRLARAACADPAKAVVQAGDLFSELATKAASGGLDVAMNTVIVPVLRELAARFPGASVGGRGRRKTPASLLWPLMQARAKAEAKCAIATTQTPRDTDAGQEEKAKKRQRRREPSATPCGGPEKRPPRTKPRPKSSGKRPRPEPSSVDSSHSPGS